MEKITYDIVFNLKNNPSSSLREINKVLIDIQRNTQNIASVVTTQMSMMQNPIDEARSKWLGLTKDTGAFFAVFSENSSGILLLITMYEKLEKLGATTKIASVAQDAYNKVIDLGKRAIYVYQMRVLAACGAISTTTGATKALNIALAASPWI